MSVYTNFFNIVLSSEEDAVSGHWGLVHFVALQGYFAFVLQNGMYTPTWNGRVSPIAQEMLQLLAKRLGLGVLEQGAWYVYVCVCLCACVCTPCTFFSCWLCLFHVQSTDRIASW